VAQQDPDTEFDALASQLGGLLIEQVAPEETEFYNELIEAHRSSKNAASRKTDHPFAFGVGEIVALLSPVMYEAAKIIIKFLIEEITEIIKKTPEEIAKQYLSDWIRQRLSKPLPIELSSDKITAFTATLRDQLKDSKITEDEKTRTLATVEAVLRGKISQ
jgi:hypothetical protein